MASILLKPKAVITGGVIALTTGAGQTGYFNRDALATAYLTLLEHDSGPGAGRAAVEVVEGGHKLTHKDAMRHVLAAATCIRHNIEP